MLGLFRHPPARPGRARGRVVLRLEGFEFRDTPSDVVGLDNPAVSPSQAPVFDGRTNQPPVIQVFTEEIGIGLIMITGAVSDESPGGLTVRFGGIPSAANKFCVTHPDGTFSLLLSVHTDGSDIGDLTAQTRDAQGLDSNVDWDSVRPTPPRGG